MIINQDNFSLEVTGEKLSTAYDLEHDTQKDRVLWCNVKLFWRGLKLYESRYNSADAIMWTWEKMFDEMTPADYCYNAFRNGKHNRSKAAEFTKLFGTDEHLLFEQIELLFQKYFRKFFKVKNLKLIMEHNEISFREIQ